MIRRTCAAAALASFALSLLTGCDQGTAPAGTQPVSFGLASNAGTLAAAGPLTLGGVRLVVGEASFGVGDQFGCVDCQQVGPETDPAPALVEVPLDGGTVQLAHLFTAQDRDREAGDVLERWPWSGGGVSFVFGMLERGRTAERLGDRRKAAESYQFVSDAWLHADPELQPYVAEARDALARLTKE